MATVPHSIEAEKAVLGSVLIRPALLEELNLTSDAFHLPAHRDVWEAMEAAAAHGREIDPVSVGAEIAAVGKTARLEGGDLYLTELAESVPTTENAQHYAAIVRETAGLRRLIAACADTASKAAEGEGQLGELAETLSEALVRLSTGRSDRLTYLRDLLPETCEGIERRASQSDVITGCRFGVTKLDRMLFGLQPGDLAIVAADTGAGKTALAQQAGILNCADGGATLEFNLEMPNRQLAERAIAHDGRINSELLRRGDVTFKDWSDRITPAQERLSKLDLCIEDQCFTLAEIGAKSRAWRTRHGQQRGLVIVDFLQLVDERTAKGETRAVAVGRVAKSLKRLAKKLNVAVIALSQFNRGPAQHEREPTKSDLKESGDIEQAADVILLIHNPESTDDGHVTLIVDKHRNGPRFKTQAWWEGRYFRFSDPRTPMEDSNAND